MVHLGLGAFFRAHQAWYTAASSPDWGIAAFTGRGPEAAERLARQDGVYTLVERGPTGDRHHQIDSIVETHDGADQAALNALVTRPEVTVVTLTVTEKGYRLDADGQLDATDPDVTADARELSRDLATSRALRTVPARLLAALYARHRAGAGPIAVIPCDNLPANGRTVHGALQGMARLAHSDPTWLEQTVDFISTSVDRITPRTTHGDVIAVHAACGYKDTAPVIAEPFTSWVLSGTFRAPRPPWERAGATIVGDIEPFERRKLWLLNGAHSLLAYSGLLRGHETVEQAVTDPQCRTQMRDLWALAITHLPEHADLRTTEYCAALEARFANPRMSHSLHQIAADGTLKLRARLVDLTLDERSAGRDAEAAVAAIRAWVRYVVSELSAGRTVEDTAASQIAAAMRKSDPVHGLISLLSPKLAADVDLVQQVRVG
ncbi:mannitol dehydrogenase family protein [Microbacterium esteraromaticum]|nr:mannitol dehydrogenase family protein [Microbacterium esteraromaticum]